ncbi:response regulator [Sphingobacterium multivorum]|uniref:response regulator n=1 Tax=Sphingobacterium multivorum TaxID=28454 RepID=UPI003DA2F1F5
MPRCDVISLIDINMPELNGFETTKHLKSKYPEMKIITFSANDTLNDILGMLECGANGYISKSAELHELTEGINSVIDGINFLCPKSRELTTGTFEPRITSTF